MVDDRQWDRAVATLGRARVVALGCHVDPDGDALGSMLALQEVLARRGAQVFAGWAAENAEPHEPPSVPPAYRDMPWVDRIAAPGSFPAAPEVFVALDCARPERLGGLRRVCASAGTVIVVDHHAQGRVFGDIRLVEPDASATAELVFELMTRLGATLDRDLASWLYVGLVTDTGRFAYASATPDTLRLGAHLMEAGIDHAAINRRVWDTHRLAYLGVLSQALERTTLLDDDDLVYTVVTRDDLASAGVTMSEIEGIIDVVRGVDSAECALVLKQQPDGWWKASLRSKSRVDVGVVAERLGGGGHRFAAGFTARGEPQEIVDRVVRMLRSTAVAADGGAA